MQFDEKSCVNLKVLLLNDYELQSDSYCSHAVWKSIKKLASLGKIIILLENFVFGRDRLISQTTFLRDYWMKPSDTQAKDLPKEVSEFLHRVYNDKKQ